ncbi:MAG TPA: PepSY domain-containing protein [Steroidobacteraceae bacterium]|nr:PepSY domain-containing protein [Steroidobacteraceae bacterium]
MALNRCLVLGTLCLLLAGAAWPAGTAHAEGHGRRGAERSFADRGISLDEAVARAERRYKARAVKAEEKRHGDRIEYRIRLLGDDGRVFEVRVDAATGRER